MRRIILLFVGLIFLLGCEEESVQKIDPYATELGDENAGGYVVIRGENCYPIGLYIHIDHDTVPFGMISSDEPALLNLSPGTHHLSVKSNGGVIVFDDDENPISKVYMQWDKEIEAEADYAPLVPLDCDSAVLDSVPWEDDGYEENDRYSAAYDLTGDEGRKLDLIDGNGMQFDDDWYEIYVASGDTLVEVTCEFTHIRGDIDIELYDSLVNVVSSSNSSAPGSDNEFISWVVSSGGTYYIRVYGDDSGNEYNLLWNSLSP
ncbi:MAG: PPC domain-containing protein [Candidatus Krumholzibacteriota bacterium]|nr:PPC domain-containing protein [Candidatus Krumholzibacteriota bacterium]